MCDNKLEIARILGASALPLVGCVIVGSGFDPEKAMTEWYDKLKQPRLTPPNWVYSAVWSYLYPTTGYASYLVWKTGGGFEGAARRPLMLYGATLGLNWAFSPLYFGRRDVKAGFYVFLPMTLLVSACGYSFHQVNQAAGRLFIPYALWCAFATYLTYKVWKLNPEETVCARKKSAKNK